MELNALNSTLIFAIGALLARITDIIKLFANILSFLKKKEAKTEIYKIENSNLQRSFNPRFGFSYIEPRTWDRIDPYNEDGNEYRHPTRSEVSYTVCGIYDIFDDNDIFVTKDRILDYGKSEKRFKLLLSRPSGTYCCDYAESKMIDIEKIRAWKLKYKMKDKESGKNLTVMVFLCNYDGICFSIHCQSPTKEYENFEDFFLFLITKFRILGSNSAPYARNKE